jgi:hypothetical protein
MKRLAKFLLGGVVVQILIALGVLLAGKFLSNSPEGPLRSLEEFTVIAFIFSSPGLMLFGPTATEGNPHPQFSGMGLLLGIIVNILVYSIIVYIAAGLWRNLKAHYTKPR